ncbi:MAG: flagellar export chaperone FliS [Phycisphaerales bacterium]|nr:flagellar export chaperone FliS [Phycisphaerales bacterium]
MAMPADTNQADAYLATKVLTASPAELRLMLLDGAIKFCTQGRDALEKKNFEGCYNGFSRTRNILVELVGTMKPEPNPDLYNKLSALYMFMISRLLQASHEKNVVKANEVIDLLHFERETWVMAMQKAAQELKGTNVNDPLTAALTAPAQSNTNRPNAPRAVAHPGLAAAAGDGFSSVSFQG